LLLFVSVAILLLGIGLLFYSIHTLLAISPTDLEQLLSLPDSSYRFIAVGTGLGMTIVGIVGLWKALGAIFPY
jgi:hypothetical protein